MKFYIAVSVFGAITIAFGIEAHSQQPLEVVRIAASSTPIRRGAGAVVLVRSKQIPRVVVLIDTNVVTWSSYRAALMVGERLQRIHRDTLSGDLEVVPKVRWKAPQTASQRATDRQSVAGVIERLRRSPIRNVDGLGMVRSITASRSPSPQARRTGL